MIQEHKICIFRGKKKKRRNRRRKKKKRKKGKKKRPYTDANSYCNDEGVHTWSRLHIYVCMHIYVLFYNTE